MDGITIKLSRTNGNYHLDNTADPVFQLKLTYQIIMTTAAISALLKKQGIKKNSFQKDLEKFIKKQEKYPTKVLPEYDLLWRDVLPKLGKLTGDSLELSFEKSHLIDLGTLGEIKEETPSTQEKDLIEKERFPLLKWSDLTSIFDEVKALFKKK